MIAVEPFGSFQVLLESQEVEVGEVEQWLAKLRYLLGADGPVIQPGTGQLRWPIQLPSW